LVRATAPREREDETDQSETGTEETTSESEIKSIEEKAKIAITQLWTRYRPAILDRVSVVEAAAVELLKGSIDGFIAFVRHDPQPGPERALKTWKFIRTAELELLSQ